MFLIKILSYLVWVLSKPPTTDQPSHRPLTTYPPTHQPVTHRLTDWLPSIYVKI